MRPLLAALLLFGAAEAAAEGLSLPFDGRWFVLHAGDTPNVNHHMSSPSQAYGVDFAKVGGAAGRELVRREPLGVEDAKRASSRHHAGISSRRASGWTCRPIADSPMRKAWVAKFSVPARSSASSGSRTTLS